MANATTRRGGGVHDPLCLMMSAHLFETGLWEVFGHSRPHLPRQPPNQYCINDQLKSKGNLVVTIFFAVAAAWECDTDLVVWSVLVFCGSSSHGMVAARAKSCVSVLYWKLLSDGHLFGSLYYIFSQKVRCSWSCRRRRSTGGERSEDSEFTRNFLTMRPPTLW